MYNVHKLYRIKGLGPTFLLRVRKKSADVHMTMKYVHHFECTNPKLVTVMEGKGAFGMAS